MKSEPLNNLLLFYTGLNTRQQKIVQLVTLGYTSAEIAYRLHISAAGVADYLTTIYKKLHEQRVSQRYPNRAILIRVFTLFFACYPALQTCEDDLLFTIHFMPHYSP